MFVEDLSPFFADFGVPATFGGQTATVLLDMPGVEIFDGMQQSNEYAMTYRATDLAGLVAGSTVVVNGTPYKVRQTTPQEDGALIKALLKR